MENTAAAKTPGYNCRLIVRFSADRNGRPLAHAKAARSVFDRRWIRVSTDAARLWVAQEQADELQ